MRVLLPVCNPTIKEASDLSPSTPHTTIMETSIMVVAWCLWLAMSKNTNYKTK
eukprot:m.95267 g.95267  ORF g.95267 m.95267 type:complete len:53 (-) comp21908_c0_seq3:122-280(-)